MSESKANLRRHRGNHMQTLSILGSTVNSPDDIYLAGSPTPAVQPLRNHKLMSSVGPSPRVFFSRGGGGRVFDTPSFRLAFTQSPLLHLRHRFETHHGCLQDAQNPAKMLPKGRQDPSKYIIHAHLVLLSLFNSSFIPLPAF